MTVHTPRITIAEFNALCADQAPFVQLYGFRTEVIEWGRARVRLPAGAAHVRPGGTVSGPSMMALADFTLYAAVLSRIGPVGLAVTTSLCCNFLRRPAPGDIVAEAHILKLGRRLAYGDISLFSDGSAEEGPVAHATATYSIPPGVPK